MASVRWITVEEANHIAKDDRDRNDFEEELGRGSFGTVTLRGWIVQTIQTAPVKSVQDSFLLQQTNELQLHVKSDHAVQFFATTKCL